MATYNVITKQLAYTAADERLVSNVKNLFAAMAEYDGDEQARTDAKTAANAAGHCLERIAKQRNGK